jgi:hypothetical protein
MFKRIDHVEIVTDQLDCRDDAPASRFSETGIEETADG